MKLKTLDRGVNRQRLLVNLDQSQAFIAPRNPYIRLIGEPYLVHFPDCLLPLVRHLEISTPSLHVNINRIPPEEMASFLRLTRPIGIFACFAGSPDLGWALNEALKARRERTDRVFKAFSIPSCADSRNGFSFSSRQDGVVPIGQSKVGGAVQ